MIDFRVKIFDAEWQGHDGFKMELEYYQQQDKVACTHVWTNKSTA
jgi:hypothetical protein